MLKATKLGYGTLSAVTGLAVAASMVAGSAVAVAAEGTDDAGRQADARTQTSDGALAQSAVVKAPAVGTFAYDQTAVTSVADIAKFQGAAATLCGAREASSYTDPLTWQISVTGDVENEFTASVADLVEDEPVNRLMTCSCGGNPAGGRAIVTADVKGIPVEYLLARAGAVGGANTVTFISSDGTQVALPIGYVIGRHGVLSYELNGEEACDGVGFGNQLWLAKTPANYFLRDVVEIAVSTEDEAPAAPGAEEHPNSPNVGILTGVQA